ncbi:hypothetical protein DL771_000312 [Monosporascus sp. 5C6A]|nr:hypothetical protein DL771_000312 [Monosporascus sp. 5C6A]
MQGDRELGMRERAVLSSRYTSLWNWINATVDAQLLSSCLRELDLFHPDDDPSMQQRIVRLLKERIAPTDESTANTVRIEYIAALNIASVGHMALPEWYIRWHDPYVRTRAHNIPDIQGRLATASGIIRNKVIPCRSPISVDRPHKMGSPLPGFLVISQYTLKSYAAAL